jgi:hypothetical protein
LRYGSSSIFFFSPVILLEIIVVIPVLVVEKDPISSTTKALFRQCLGLGREALENTLKEHYDKEIACETSRRTEA